jgi:hypothetical protein
MTKTTPFLAGMCRALLNEGRSLSRVAKVLGVTPKTARKLRNFEDGLVKKVCRRCVQRVDKRRALVKVCALATVVKDGKVFPKNPSTTYIAQAVEEETGLVWSKSSIRRDLLAMGFIPRVRRHATSRSARVFSKRLEFALKWLNGSAESVVFTDEHQRPLVQDAMGAQRRHRVQS